MRGVEVLSSLDLDATPPFDHAHDHFGYRDRLSQPVIEGSGDEPTPGSGGPLKAGEFLLGYPDEDGNVASQPEPESSAATAATRPTAAWRSTWGVPRLPARARPDAGGTGTHRRQAHGPLAERRPARPGAGEGRPGPRGRPAAQATSITRNRTLTATPCPWAHIRRMNPRDTAANMNGAPDPTRGHLWAASARRRAGGRPGRDRAFVICRSLIRQFEFAQKRVGQ